MSHNLEAKAVTKTYRAGNVDTVALREVDFTMERGEFTVLFGPSGSGKTTLLNLLGGLDRPSSGKIYLKDREISGLSDSELSRLRLFKIGFVFQSYNLIPVLTALENVEYVLILQKVPRQERQERAKKLLEQLGLGELINKRPTEMSGGQQQRVAVARAIVHLPELVLADEPTANLDSKTAHELMDMMHKLNQEKGISFLFSTHDPMVMEHAKRLVELRDGRITNDELRTPKL
jgi:putative ABC transport system ATP-binding protein